MAVDLYTDLLFPYSSTQPCIVSNNPQKHISYVDYDLDELSRESNTNTEQIALSQEIMKRRRNQSIVLCEKIRRKRMRQLFSKLHSLLPSSATNSPKVARYCMVEETAKYIQKLQNKVQELQQKKVEIISEKNIKRKGSLVEHNLSSITSKLNILATDCASPMVGVEVYSCETVIIRITASKMPQFLSKIYEEIETHDLEVERADVYMGKSIILLYFHSRVTCSVENWMQRIQTIPTLQASLQNIY